ncbi:MAG TPA: hypothetical protein IAA76_08630 [Candidatus Ornithospirochaeta stercorigallinarum]|nr:hypothetical protein [Candidatus Ornithospirochaeta stercorigallinarum]
MDYFGEEWANAITDFDSDNAVVLSIDKKRVQSEGGTEVGLTWSEDVFNYMFDNMDFKRIEKFFEDSYNASYQNYIAMMMGRQLIQ